MDGAMRWPCGVCPSASNTRCVGACVRKSGPISPSCPEFSSFGYLDASAASAIDLSPTRSSVPPALIGWLIGQNLSTPSATRMASTDFTLTVEGEMLTSDNRRNSAFVMVGEDIAA